MNTRSSIELDSIWQPYRKKAKYAKTLGTKNAKNRTSKFTSITETNIFPYAENAGAPSQKKTSNGEKLNNFPTRMLLVVSQTEQMDVVVFIANLFALLVFLLVCR